MGGFRYRRIEMLPMIAPAIAQALAEAKLITSLDCMAIGTR